MTQEVAPEEPKPEELKPEEPKPDEKMAVGTILEGDGPNSRSKQQIICVTITGTPQGVKETIFTLYQLGFAAVDDWSPVQPGAHPQQVISVLIRRKRAAEEKQQKRSKQ